jgi:hypothetical protein
MDFRVAPKPAEFAWHAPRGGVGKTKTCGATYLGKKIVVQTPSCAARMFKDPRSTALYLSLTDDVQREFGDFVKSYEDHAAKELVGTLAEKELSGCLRNNGGSFRVTAWDDVQWFDHKGTFLKEPPTSVNSIVCVMEFGGVWVTDAKWGLKWRVSQIMTGPPENTSSSAPASSSYAFLE